VNLKATLNQKKKIVFSKLESRTKTDLA